MHAYRRFVQEQMDEHRWRAADLARHSGVSKQVISTLLNDDREVLSRPPRKSTIKGFARAFGGADMEQRLWLRVAASMGLPLGDEVLVADPGRLSNHDLVRELQSRLRPERHLRSAAYEGDGDHGEDPQE